jgi:hypothetical protein
MPKALSIMGMLIGFLILLVFVLDLVLGFPFGSAKAGIAMHVGMIIGAGMLLYVSWAAYREQS